MVSIETKKYLTKNRTVSAKKRHITLSVRPYKSMIKVSSLSTYHSAEHLLMMMDSKSGRHCWRKLSLGLAKCRRGDPGGLDSHQRLGVGARSFWKKWKWFSSIYFLPAFFIIYFFSLMWLLRFSPTQHKILYPTWCGFIKYGIWQLVIDILIILLDRTYFFLVHPPCPL